MKKLIQRRIDFLQHQRARMVKLADGASTEANNYFIGRRDAYDDAIGELENLILDAGMQEALVNLPVVQALESILPDFRHLSLGMLRKDETSENHRCKVFDLLDELHTKATNALNFKKEESK